MDNVAIGRGLADDEREHAAQLYWQAFGRKLRPGFANSPTALEMIRSGLRSDQVFVARRDGAVIGICGFYHRRSGAVDMSWRRIRRLLSLPAAIRATVALTVLSRAPKPDTVVLDGICVHPSSRGAGVGTALLDASVDYAQSVGATAVSLSVIDSNPRAKRLYERCGFATVASGRLGLLGYIYGFDGYTTMQREVQS